MTREGCQNACQPIAMTIRNYYENVQKFQRANSGKLSTILPWENKFLQHDVSNDFIWSFAKDKTTSHACKVSINILLKE